MDGRESGKNVCGRKGGGVIGGERGVTRKEGRENVQWQEIKEGS